MTKSSEITDSTVEKEYWSVLSSAGMAQRNAAFLEVNGTDAPDFLQRMSTNDMKELKPYEVCRTLLVTEKAKVIDLLTVIHLETHLLLICSEGNGKKVKEWLDKFIIMENIQITDVTSDYIIFLFLGPHVKSILSDFLNEENVEDNRSVLKLKQLAAGYLYRDDLWTIPAYHIITTRKDSGSVKNELAQRIPEIEHDIIQILRIEQGIPAYGVELSEHVNPLEAGLEKYVSFTKGCYIGQEVIARLDTYQKLNKKLSGFTFSHFDPHKAGLGTLFDHNNEVGLLTSQTWSFRLKKLIALGYLKTTFGGKEMELRPTEGGQSSIVYSHPLPF